MTAELNFPTTTDAALELLRAALLDEADAWRALERQRVQMPTFLANVELRIRREAAEAGEKVTESTIAARLAAMEPVLEARQRETDLEYTYRLAKAGVTVAEAVVSLRKAELYASAGREVRR